MQGSREPERLRGAWHFVNDQLKPSIIAGDADVATALTTTLPHMSETIAALKAEGLRGSVKRMIGGAPVTEARADEVGADGYGANAGMAVERAKELMA